MKSSFFGKKASFQPSETEEPDKLLGTSSVLLMMTPSRLLYGYKRLLIPSVEDLLKGYLEHPSSHDGIDISVTYSVTKQSRKYTIEFFLKDGSICLAILPIGEPGQQEPVKSPVITKEKFTFLKHVICLLKGMLLKK